MTSAVGQELLVTRPTAPGEGRGRTSAGGWPNGSGDDGWGPATAVYSAAARAAAVRPPAARPFYPSTPTPPAAPTDSWAPAGPRAAREQRAVRAAERQAAYDLRADETERGLRWWAALIVLLAIAGAGGIIDTLGSLQAKNGFNVGIVIASLVAILVVKRSHMFPVVIAPPIVYSGAALLQLYLRSNGLHDRYKVTDAALNYLVYGFPAIAASTAVVLIIAGIRLIARK